MVSKLSMKFYIGRDKNIDYATHIMISISFDTYTKVFKSILCYLSLHSPVDSHEYNDLS